MVEKIEVKKVPKVWGEEIWMVNDALYCGKKLIVNRGFRSSLHYHRNKDETFYIERGRVLLELGVEGRALEEEDMIRDMIEDGLDYEGNLEITVMEKGNALRIKPYTLHRYGSLRGQAVIIEISTHHEDSDTYKLEDAVLGVTNKIPPEVMKKYNR